MNDLAFLIGYFAGILSTLFAAAIILAIIVVIIRHYEK